MAQLKHPNVVNIIGSKVKTKLPKLTVTGVVTAGTPLLLIVQFCENGKCKQHYTTFIGDKAR